MNACTSASFCRIPSGVSSRFGPRGPGTGRATPRGARRRTARRSNRATPPGDVLVHGRVAGDVADSAFDAPRSLGDGVSEYPRGSARRFQEAEQDSNRGRFSRPVGPEKAEYSPDSTANVRSSTPRTSP